MTPGRDVSRLLAIMAALRTPGTGCPWDLEQSFATVVPYTLEEAYEVADAVQRGDFEDLRDELGDLLLQIVFHARMAEEAGRFDFGDVVEAITAKLVRRHPHVFGERQDLDAAAVKALWESIKQVERRERAARHPIEAAPSALDGVPPVFPALMRADKLTRKAARVGFDWPDAEEVAAKVEEELQEVRDAARTESAERVRDEVGDLLFAAANLARHHGIDPEAALHQANRKFERRFRGVEGALAALGRSPETSDLAEMERLWGEVKAAEARPPDGSEARPAGNDGSDAAPSPPRSAPEGG